MSENKQRKYQVFISSTFSDLAELRKKAVEAVVERGHMPIALENFSARTESDLNVIKQTLSSCQIYIAILGARYGTLVKEGTEQYQDSNQISYTELEYRIAEELGLEVLPFILKKSEIDESRRSLDSNKERDRNELKNLERLEVFHRHVSGSRFYKPFSMMEEFKFLITSSLVDCISTTTRPGWVLEPEEAEDRVVLHSLVESPFIGKIVNQLNSFKALSERCGVAVEEKEAAANVFCSNYLQLIIDTNLNLFFESGSTIASLADAMASELSKAIVIDPNGKPSFQVLTNNVLAHQIFWLCHDVPVSLFPWGRPEISYGAAFGSIGRLQDRHQDFGFPGLKDIERTALNNVKRLPFSFFNDQENWLLLGAVSGLQLSDSIHVTESSKQFPNREVEDDIKRIRGGHVGSYKNKLFKRAMFESGHPIMIFLESSKIDCKIDLSKCRFVCDGDFTFTTICNEYPIAFCVGCECEDWKVYSDMFSQRNFEIINGNCFESHTGFIARNKLFIEKIEKGNGFDNL